MRLSDEREQPFHNVAIMIYTFYARNKSKRGNARTSIVIRDCVKSDLHLLRTEKKKL